jgi:hypothetical protein
LRVGLGANEQSGWESRVVDWRVLSMARTGTGPSSGSCSVCRWPLLRMIIGSVAFLIVSDRPLWRSGYRVEERDWSIALNKTLVPVTK